MSTARCSNSTAVPVNLEEAPAVDAWNPRSVKQAAAVSMSVQSQWRDEQRIHCDAGWGVRLQWPMGLHSL